MNKAPKSSWLLNDRLRKTEINALISPILCICVILRSQQNRKGFMGDTCSKTFWMLNHTASFPMQIKFVFKRMRKITRIEQCDLYNTRWLKQITCTYWRQFPYWYLSIFKIHNDKPLFEVKSIIGVRKDVAVIPMNLWSSERKNSCQLSRFRFPASRLRTYEKRSQRSNYQLNDKWRHPIWCPKNLLEWNSQL